MIQTVHEIDSIEKLWVKLEMDSVLTSDTEIRNHMNQFLNYLNANLSNWKKGKTQNVNINIPNVYNSNSSQELRFNLETNLEVQRLLSIEREKHLGYPITNKKGRLDCLKCNYPECGRVFKCRDHLFKHLKLMIPENRMITGHHKKHWGIKYKHNQKSTTCTGCDGKDFGTTDALLDHYVLMGVSSKTGTEYLDNVAKRDNNNNDIVIDDDDNEKFVDAYENQNECVICMNAPRGVVIIPCGHLICCENCVVQCKECPLCRGVINDNLKVFFG